MEQTRSLSEFTWCPKLSDFTLVITEIVIVCPSYTANNLLIQWLSVLNMGISEISKVLMFMIIYKPTIYESLVLLPDFNYTFTRWDHLADLHYYLFVCKQRRVMSRCQPYNLWQLKDIGPDEHLEKFERKGVNIF